MNTVSTFEKALKKTLFKAITDKDVTMSGARFLEVFKKSSMSDAYETFQIWGGIGRADEQTEGANITVGSVSEGPTFTFYARKFGKKMVITDEAIEDCKYKEAIKGAKRCTRAVVKAAEHEGALVFDNSFDTSYPFGDGVPLCSASHPLAVGGTFSNLFSVSMAPGVAAYTEARKMARQFPSYDGLIDGLTIKKVICPVEQETEWEIALNSRLDTDDPGNHAAVNVAQRAGLDVCVNEYITSTATANWFQTDAEDGLMYMERRAMQGRTWSNNDQQTVCYASTIRWAFGHANPRCIIGNEGL